jgi:branched-chain amino acid transport system permease protein
MLLQLIISGILLGGVYALTSMGLSLVFGVSKIINFAHGDFVVIGMYSALSIYYVTGLGPYISWILVIPISFAIGWLAFQLIKKTIGGEEINQIFITIGLSMVIQNLLLMTFKSDYRTLKSSFSKSLEIGNIYISYESLLAFLIAVAVTIAFLWFLNRTDLGRAMRAVSQDRDAASLMGVKVELINVLAFGLGITMAGLAGGLLLTMYAAYPTAGGVYNLLAWVIVVLGGLGQVEGALAAAFLIGICETLTGFYIGPDFRQVVYYLFFIAILIIRPQGLFSGIRMHKKVKHETTA